MATPWAGLLSARLGTVLSPVVVPSWRGVAAGSEFLAGLFATPLASNVRFDLVYPYPMPSNPGTIPTGDGVVAFGSMLYPPAVREATRVHVLEGSHAGVLQSSEFAATIRQIFDEATSGR